MSVGPFVRWVSGSLRVASWSLSGKQLTDRLGLSPTSVDERGTPIGRSGTATREATIWIIDDGLPDNDSISAHLTAPLDLIEPRLSLISQLPSPSECDIVIGFGSDSGQGSDSLTPEVLGRLAATGLNLVIHLYPGEENVTGGTPR